jgi:hypothetical protein
MNRKLILPLAVLCFACESKEPAPAAAPSAAPAQPQAQTAIARDPAPAVDLDSVPVEEDFEQEAATQLDAKNLGATLDALEKEIATE